MEEFKIYKIDGKQLDKFMLKRALFLSGIILSMILFLILLILIFSGFKSPLKLISALSSFIIYPVLFIFVLAFIMRSQFTSKRFGLNNDSFFEFHNKEELSIIASAGMRSNEMRSGQKRSQIIPFKKIDEIKFKKDKIVIKSYDYNMWNANGKITVPAEIESYDEFKAHVVQKFEKKIHRN